MKSKLETAPLVFCPREKKEIPVWNCLGSFVQQKATCEFVGSVTIAKGKATVECLCPLELKGPVKIDLSCNSSWQHRWAALAMKNALLYTMKIRLVRTRSARG